MREHDCDCKQFCTLLPSKELTRFSLIHVTLFNLVKNTARFSLHSSSAANDNSNKSCSGPTFTSAPFSL